MMAYKRHELSKEIFVLSEVDQTLFLFIRDRIPTEKDWRAIGTFRNVIWFWLQNSELPQSGLKALALWPALEAIQLENVQIRVDSPQNPRVKTESLILYQCSGVTPAFLESFSESELQSLALYTHLTGFSSTSRLTFDRLQALTIAQTGLHEETVVDVINRSPEFRHLAIFNEGNITLAVLEKIEHPENIKSLTLGALPITDQNINILVRFSNLQELVIYDTPITDESVPTLLSIDTLESIYFSDTQISEENVQKLRRIASEREEANWRYRL